MEEHKKKGEEFVENTNQIEQNLKELYHGKFHKDIEPRFYNSVKEGQRESYKKVKDYSVGVFENHRPRVDLKKRDKIEETIREL